MFHNMSLHYSEIYKRIRTINIFNMQSMQNIKDLPIMLEEKLCILLKIV